MKKRAIALLLISLFMYSGITQDAKDYYNYYVDAYYDGDIVRGRKYLDSILLLGLPLSQYHESLVHNNIAKMQYLEGNFESTKHHFEKSLLLIEEKEKYKNLVAESNMGLGNLYRVLGENIRAISFYNEAKQKLDEKKRKDNKDWELYSLLLQNYSEVYWKLGNYSKQLEYLELAHNLIQSKKLISSGLYHKRLANANHSVGNKDEANFHYRKAIEIYLQDGDSTKTNLAPTYLDYARFLQYNNRDSLALIYYKMALEIYYSNYGSMNPYTANCHVRIGDYFIKKKKFDSAEFHINKAIKILQPKNSINDSLNNYYLQYSKHDNNLLQAFWYKTELYSKWSESINNPKIKIEKLIVADSGFKHGINHINKYQSLFYTHSSRRAILKNNRSFFGNAISNSLKLLELTGNEKYLERAYMYTSISKGIELKHEMNLREMINYLQLPEKLGSQLYNEIINIKAYSNLLNQGDLEHNRINKFQKNYNERLIISYYKLDSLIRCINGIYPKFENLLAQHIVFDMKAIQKYLGRSSVILDYYIGEEKEDATRQMVVFLIKKKELVFHDTIVPSSMLKNIMRFYSKQSMNHDLHSKSQSSNDTLLFELYKHLIEPFKKKIESKSIIIIPDEELSFLPFELLLTRIPYSAKSSTISYPYLIKRNAISYGYSAQSLLMPKGKRYLHSFTSIVPEYIKSEGNTIKSLPMAKVESKVISKYFMQNKIYEETLSKQKFLNLLENCSNLHIAMHTQSDMTNDLASYFIFTDSLGDEKFCKNFEIEACDIKAPMVSLVACNTGSGPYYSGDGIANLSRSFLLAGAGSVIHTMWDIEDQVSAIIMEQYYKNLAKGYNKSESLKKAKLYYINTISPAFSGPEYWAAFQLTGDISPIRRGIRLIRILVIVALLALLTTVYLCTRSRRMINSLAAF